MKARIPALLSVFLPLVFSGCTIDDDDDGSSLNPAVISAVRAELAAAGVVAVPAPPAVSQDLVDLGHALFFDKILSGNMDTACSTCHLPQFAAADGRTLPGGSHGTGIGPARTGGDIVPRNSPSVLNAHLMETAFWDSRIEFDGGMMLSVPVLGSMPADELAALDPGLEIVAAQAMFPPTSRQEMRGQMGENSIADLGDTDIEGVWDALTARILAVPAYQTLFAAAYPAVQMSDINFGHVGNAIAAFEMTGFARFDSPFQAFVEGDDTALNENQLAGALEFFTTANCGACHDGPAFGGNNFRNIGMPQFGPGHADGPMADDDFGREAISGNMIDRYRFRTPGLLNTELTAPYGHLGQFATLESIVDHYKDAAASLNSYDITEHVSDPALVGTQLANQAAVLATLDPTLVQPSTFDTPRIVDFLNSLTADSARDLTDLIPASVPSGLPVD